EQERRAVHELDIVWAELRPVAAEVNEGALASDPSARRLGELLPALRLQTRRVADASQAAIRARLETSANASRRAERGPWTVGAGTLGLALLIATLIIRSASRGLRRLQMGTQRVALGDFDYRLPADGRDELAQLARDFNVMIRRLGELDRMKRD